MTGAIDRIAQLSERALTTEPLGHYAAIYASGGFEVFPVNPDTKAPLVSQKLATTDLAIVANWWARWPGALIGHRVAHECVVLDVDPRHGGDAVWEALEDEFGPIPVGRMHFSGRGDGGCHAWFRWPDGSPRPSTKRLTEWAQDHEVGAPVLDRGTGKPMRWTCGIDVLTNGWRYSILPPSPHPDTGKPYYWREPNGELGAMPDALAELLAPVDGPGADQGEAEDDAEDEDDDRPRLSVPLHDLEHSDSIADWFTATRTWASILVPHGWTLVQGDGDRDGSLWRHPDADPAHKHSASIRHGLLFVYSANTVFNPTEDGDPNGYTKFRAWAVLEHGGNLSVAARAARALKGDAGVPAATATSVACNLPDEFWQARPELTDIRRYAHGRGRSADAVYAAVRARLCALIPPGLTIDTGVAVPVSLNCLVAIIGHSGAGKSTSIALGATAVPIDRKDIFVGPLGSGEGVVEAFFEQQTRPKAGGKGSETVKVKTMTGALLMLDEGEALARMGLDRKGTTLLPTLRSGYSAAMIGQTNAKADTRRALKAGDYRLVLLVGLQDTAASMLLGDSATGSPQRFVMFSANDPTIPADAPAVPPPWGPTGPWVPPTVGVGQSFTLDAGVRAEVRANDLDVQRGVVIREPLDSHRDQNRLKEAGMLAVLGGRLDITAEDWQLAGMVMDASDAVRAGIIARNGVAAQKAEDDRTHAAARRQVKVAQSLDADAHERAVVGGAREMARVVQRSKPDPVTRRRLTQATSSKYRQEASADEMLARAEDHDWLRPTGDAGWVAGGSAPA